MDISSRIKSVRLSKKLSSKDFAVKIGMDTSQYSKVERGKLAPTLQQVMEISSICGISSDWLLFGKGDKPGTIGLMTDEEITAQDREVEQGVCKVSGDDPANKQGIPLIPIDAMAGAALGELQIMEYECERYVVPMFRGAEYLIPVKGDSMQPKYTSGDVVACKNIPLNDLFFEWNRPYVIDTKLGAMIKRIRKGKDDDHVLVVSENTDYEPFELHKSQINAVALVVGVIRLE